MESRSYFLLGEGWWREPLDAADRPRVEHGSMTVRSCAGSSRYCVAFMPFSSIPGGKAATDRTNITGLPVTGVFWHLPFEPFRVSDELEFCMPTLRNTSILPFAGISQPFLTSFGRITDKTIVLLQFYEIALSPRCWRQQQVSSSLHTFCPILLRQITPHYPWIDPRTPLGVLAAHPPPWLSALTHAEIALDSLTQGSH